MSLLLLSAVWAAREKASGGELASGTWTVSRK
jgi:hypothetical protein